MINHMKALHDEIDLLSALVVEEHILMKAWPLQPVKNQINRCDLQQRPMKNRFFLSHSRVIGKVTFRCGKTSLQPLANKTILNKTIRHKQNGAIKRMVRHYISVTLSTAAARGGVIWPHGVVCLLQMYDCVNR